MTPKIQLRPISGRAREAGGGYVVLQFALMAVAAAGWLVPGRPDSPLLRAIGIALAVPGLLLFAWAFRTLGRSFTPFPVPRANARLVDSGPFRLVRHPTYGGGLVSFAGISLSLGLLGLVGTAALAVVWWRKSEFEEHVLTARFPGYADYRRRVRRRFLPWLL
jgi:protein-S-isoprenylcysteine O-methyltransferase Ste14